MPILLLLQTPLYYLATLSKSVAFASLKIFLFIGYITLGISILFTASYLLLDGISATFPQTAQMVWGWFMPPNAFGCITTIVTIRILRAGYDFKVQLAKLKVSTIKTR